MISINSSFLEGFQYDITGSGISERFTDGDCLGNCIFFG